MAAAKRKVKAKSSPKASKSGKELLFAYQIPREEREGWGKEYEAAKAKAKREGRKIKIVTTKREVRIYLKAKHKPSPWQKYIKSKGSIMAAVEGKNSGDYDKWLARQKK